MKRLWLQVIVAACLFMQPQAASAASDPVFTDLIGKMSATEGFSCRFRQVVYFAEGGERAYTGTLTVRRPGMFRWQYMTPYEQLYVSNGGDIWHYEPDLMQAERLKVIDALDPAAMRLLDGRAGSDEVLLLGSEKKESGLTQYHVRIADGPELLLAFQNDGNLYWLESKDMLGNRNRMILLEMDRSLPEMKVFDFVPPAGVDVVDLSGNGVVIPLYQTEKDGD